jgi:hypothetical protein
MKAVKEHYVAIKLLRCNSSSVNLLDTHYWKYLISGHENHYILNINDDLFVDK